MCKKVVLVTGASSGIGKATAKKLIEEGYTVYGAARRLEKMENLKKMGEGSIKMDITKEEDIKNCVDKIIKEQGKIDVLFNNAGFGLYGAVEDVSLEDARYQFEVNLFGLARITQLVLPHMRKQKSGTIINTSSIGGRIYTPFGAWYHATKHALEGWSDVLRLEVEQFGIDVVIIEPGIIETEFADAVSSSMMKNSGDGLYKDMAKVVAKSMEDSYKEGNGSCPTVIAKTVSKAIKARKPKTRYVAGKMAKPLMFMRKWLPDKIFDKVIMSQMK
ncbi:oxidoreductase [Sporohalobacter salinus]|uniref:oxidoreductase n=1 Tax=Sporohalobacter salinus TaxID=1494606 RepID=UPI00195FF059|nr:oxidoreductase [Sporohalobacter salinus]MBM7624112.1 short-subunit dehydrogenase [Sporohalobacter salinus]